MKILQNTRNFLALIALIAVLFTACDEDTPELDYNVSFKVETHVDGNPFEMGASYVNAEGQRFRVDLLAFYLSHVGLVAADGTVEEIEEVALYNMSQDEQVLTATLPAGSYTGIRFGIGLDEALNSTDPATFPPEHPLSYVHATYWSWASKYRFLMMEGKVDADTEGDTFSHSFAYHTGLDTLYREVTIDRNITVQDKEQGELSEVVVSLNVKDIYGTSANPLDMITQNQTHAEGAGFPLAELITNNFAAALE